MGDAGTGGENQRRVARQLLAAAPEHVFLLGDNVYSRGNASRFGERFDEPYAALLERGVAFHAALGNHDVLPCEAREHDPLPADASAYEFAERGCDVEQQLAHRPFGYPDGRRYYSVRLGGVPPLVEVFVLDSNTLGASGSKLEDERVDHAQLGWLDRALAASRAEFKLVTLHHPVHTPRAKGYFLGLGGHRRDPALEAALAPIFEARGVDAAFAGHNHFYARLFPQDGVRYFVAGGGGQKTYGFKSAPGYVAAGDRFHHFLYVRVRPGVVEYFAIDADGRCRDSGFFRKGETRDTPLPPQACPLDALLAASR